MKAIKRSHQLGLEKFRVSSFYCTNTIVGGSKENNTDNDMLFTQTVSSHACGRPTVQPTQKDE